MRHTRIVVTQYGGPDELQVLEEECPEPKHGEVRLRVLAAGVSLPDLLMRECVHPETPRLGSARRYCSLGASPGWRCTALVRREERRLSPTWAVSRLITSIRTS